MQRLDLSILQWEERIETIAAFMALDLLYDGCWKGPVQLQRHHHELECLSPGYLLTFSSFIRLDNDNGICSTLILGRHLTTGNAV